MNFIIVFLMLITMIFVGLILFCASKLFDIDRKLASTNLLLTVIANKQGATEKDVKEALKPAEKK